MGHRCVCRILILRAKLARNIRIHAHPVPTATANTRFCSGKARDTAVRASWLNRATNMLSTILYIDCTSMESIGGKAIDISRGNTGFAAILLRCSICSKGNKLPFSSSDGRQNLKDIQRADLPRPLDSHLIVLKCSPIRAAGTARREPLLLGYFSISTPVLQDSAGSSLIKLRGIGPS